MRRYFSIIYNFLLFIGLLVPSITFADEINHADTAWIMTATGLVLMMLIPGLALFYAGLVRKVNFLAVLMQSFATCAFVSIIWVILGYSLVFTESNAFIGGMSKMLLAGVELKSIKGTIPESVLIAFQMAFAIITPALMLGAVADRIKFFSMIMLVCLWSIFVYCPIAHWLWGPKGMLGGTGIDNYAGIFNFGPVIDFAGGMVVHISAGISGLVLCMFMGPKRNFGKSTPEVYNIGLSLVGASLLWVGWYGFNGGSALAANENAGMALLVTHIATATASCTWMLLEYIKTKKVTVLGAITGALAGMVAITPASGFVNTCSALIIGTIAGFACKWAITCLKVKIGYDDYLDAFGAHGICGIIGSILTGIFAMKSVGGVSGMLEGNMNLLLAQITGTVITMIYSAVATYVILRIIDSLMGLRVSDQVEDEGLDLALHNDKLS